MVSELLTLYGTASVSAGGSGDFTLTSPMIYGSFTYIRIPKGMKAKIWAKRLAGTVGYTLQINFTHDVTASTPTWSVIDSEHLSSAGMESLEKRRPIVVIARTGKEAVKLSYANTTGGGTIYVDVEIEITDEE